MNKLNVTKLKMTDAAFKQLQHLQLSIADLDLIICFSHKTHHLGTTLFQFDSSFAPEAIRPQLAHLTGIILRAISGQIVDVYRDTQALFNAEKSNGRTK